jgi:hypothetical protein
MHQWAGEAFVGKIPISISVIAAADGLIKADLLRTYQHIIGTYNPPVSAGSFPHASII